MKEILLNSNPKNWDKAENELKEAQKNCKERLLYKKDIIKVIDDIEEMLKKDAYPKHRGRI